MKVLPVFIDRYLNEVHDGATEPTDLEVDGKRESGEDGVEAEKSRRTADVEELSRASHYVLEGFVFPVVSDPGDDSRDDVGDRHVDHDGWVEFLTLKKGDIYDTKIWSC